MPFTKILEESEFHMEEETQPRKISAEAKQRTEQFNKKNFKLR